MDHLLYKQYHCKKGEQHMFTQHKRAVTKVTSLQNSKTSRNPSFELLRIISMLMVVTLHFLGHGRVLENVRLFSSNFFVAWMIESLAYVTVNCFVLISGYFLVNSKFRVKKLFTLYG